MLSLKLLETSGSLRNVLERRKKWKNPLFLGGGSAMSVFFSAKQQWIIKHWLTLFFWGGGGSNSLFTNWIKTSKALLSSHLAISEDHYHRKFVSLSIIQGGSDVKCNIPLFFFWTLPWFQEQNRSLFIFPGRCKQILAVVATNQFLFNSLIIN